MGITKKQLLESIRQIKEYVDNKGSISIDPITKNWLIDNVNTGICSEGKEGKSIQSITKDENNNIIITFSDGTTQDIGQLNVDVQANFLTETGFGNLRYYNGYFQYYDTTTKTWVNTIVTSDNTYIINMIPQNMNAISGIYDIELGHYKISFEEPNDTIIENQVTCIVDKVIIRKKLGSEPIDENDGELVLEVNRKDFGAYKNNWYIDDTFQPNNGEIWYYKGFPVSTLGIVNIVTENQTVALTCKDYYLYGFTLNQNESDPASMITYIEDNIGFQPVYMDSNADTFNYGNWQDAFFMKAKPCMLNYDGTVAYYLNPNNYALKEDGTPSDIANVDFAGNAMVGIPKVYWKIVDNGNNTANVYISNKQLDADFHCWSHLDNNGNEIDYCYMPIYNGFNDGTKLRSLSGKEPMHSQTMDTAISLAIRNNFDSNAIWNIEVFSDRMLINLLLLLIGKSTDTQETFGNGYCDSQFVDTNTPRIETGTMDTKGLFWGDTLAKDKGVKVFGIEHWWAHQWRPILGWIVNKGTQKVKLTYGQSDGSTVNGYNTDGNGYIAIGCTPNGTNGNYVSQLAFTPYGLIPVKMNGSATTYYTDISWFANSSVVAVWTGATVHDKGSGAFCAYYVAYSSLTSWDAGACLSCKPLAQKGD